MKEKSSVQLIIHALLTGQCLKSKDISKMIAETDGKVIKIQDVASMLSKISDSKKCCLGYFISKSKEGNAFTYQIVKEASELTLDKAYDLTLKTGKDRYTLKQALEEFPALSKYVSAATPQKPKQMPTKKTTAKAVKKIFSETTALDISDIQGLEELLAVIIQKVIRQKGKKFNVNVSVKLEK